MLIECNGRPYISTLGRHSTSTTNSKNDKYKSKNIENALSWEHVALFGWWNGGRARSLLDWPHVFQVILLIVPWTEQGNPFEDNQENVVGQQLSLA